MPRAGARGFGYWPPGCEAAASRTRRCSTAPSRPRGGGHALDLFAGRLFQMLTGEALFQGGREIDIAKRVADAKLLNPTTDDDALPKPIRDILKKSLTQDPATRFAEVQEMRKGVDTLLFSGDFTPTTFNLAFFMHSLFRDDIDRETKLLKEERESPYLEYLTDDVKNAPATLPPMAAPSAAAIAAAGAAAAGAAAASSAPSVPPPAASAPPAPMPVTAPPSKTPSGEIPRPPCRWCLLRRTASHAIPAPTAARMPRVQRIGRPACPRARRRRHLAQAAAGFTFQGREEEADATHRRPRAVLLIAVAGGSVPEDAGRPRRRPPVLHRPDERR